AKNAIFTVSEAMEHFAYLPTGLYVFAYKKDVYLRVCTLIIFFTPQPGWMAFLLRLVVAVLVMSGVLLGMLHIMPEWSLGTMP
ncbi:hypothetical protein MMS63_28705, partial [Escherichia coli]|nr:hypothetical protein [Escherichia coli]